MKKKTFRTIFEELNGVPLEMPNNQNFDEDNFSLTDEIDHSILMHKDAHFGGDFDIMISYYEDDAHVGIDPNFDLSRIEYLYKVEKESGNNLAAAMLTVSEMEQVARCRAAYTKLKEIYELDEMGQTIPYLISDLILTEEEEPIDAINALVLRGARVVPDLINIIKSDEAYDPLFPGYGYAPYLAAICLGKIKDTSALPALFEMLRRDAIFDEDALLDVFLDFAEPAKNYLLERLTGRPLTNDNEHAAFALSAFSYDSLVAEAALFQLQKGDVQKRIMLSNYLLCLCDPLSNSPHKESFTALAIDPTVPEEIRSQIKDIVHDWH